MSTLALNKTKAEAFFLTVLKQPSPISCRQKTWPGLNLLLGALLFLLSLGCSPEKKVDLNSAGSATTTNKWDSEIDAFLAMDQTNPPPRRAILFTGSSSIRLWQGIETNFPGLKIIARGFGGSQMSDLAIQADRIVFPYEPAHVLIYEGDNDLASGKSPEGLLSDFKSVVQIIHSRLPETRITLISVKPSIKRWPLVEKVKQANALLERFCKTDRRLGYVDIFNPLLEPGGGVRKDVFVEDGLHLNQAGYAILRREIGLYLSRFQPVVR